jgi:hypothetical protein
LEKVKETYQTTRTPMLTAGSNNHDHEFDTVYTVAINGAGEGRNGMHDSLVL